MNMEAIIAAKTAKDGKTNGKASPIIHAQTYMTTTESDTVEVPPNSLCILVPGYLEQAEPLTYNTKDKDGKVNGTRTIPASAEVVLPGITLAGKNFAVNFSGKFGKSNINLT